MDSPSIQSDREMVHDLAVRTRVNDSPVIEPNGKSLNAGRVRLFGLGKECGQRVSSEIPPQWPTITHVERTTWSSAQF